MKIERGFTLIEVLLTISIIAMLITIGVASFRPSQQSARDARRRSDIKQYQLSLENYSTANNSLYPSRTGADGVSAAGVLCPDLGTFISGCPEDPRNDKDSDFTYLYQSDGDNTGAATALNWVLWARLERFERFWVVCSDARSGERDVSGFSVSGGGCPL